MIIPTRRRPKKAVSFKMAEENYALVLAYAVAHDIDVSSVINMALARVLPKLQRRLDRMNKEAA
jgi:hypothetical protein